jgi:PPOX class probable F420-dependent enzyme
MRSSERKYLGNQRRGFLATLHGVRPTIIPVCFCSKGDTIYTAIDAKPKGPRLARLSNIVENPHVAFLVDHYSEEWSELSYLLLHGEAEILKDEVEAERARDLLTRKYSQYRRLRLDGRLVLAIRIHSSKFWSFRKAVGRTRRRSQYFRDAK